MEFLLAFIRRRVYILRFSWYGWRVLWRHAGSHWFVFRDIPSDIVTAFATVPLEEGDVDELFALQREAKDELRLRLRNVEEKL